MVLEPSVKLGSKSPVMMRALLKSAVVFILLLPILSSMAFPVLMQSSDFQTAFYVAGRMVLDGRAADLYPGPEATSLIDTQLNAFAHQLLPKLSSRSTAVYMYSPLVALCFAPLTILSPQQAMIAWQATSVAALAVCASLIGMATRTAKTKLLGLSAACLPIFHTLLIGHIGIVFGLLPLCAGYFLLIRKRGFSAGVVWSLLLLKLQFLPVALLVCGALALNRQLRPALGLASGTAVLVGLSVLCLSPQVFQDWVASLRLSDTIFSDSRYGYPQYLVSSLPAVILHLVPMEARNVAKLPTYGLAAAIGLHALWLSTRRLKHHTDQADGALPLVVLVGIFVLPLVLPHYLSYDLSILGVGGMIVAASSWREPLRRNLHLLTVSAFCLVDVYVVLSLSPWQALAQPLVLVSLLVGFYLYLLSQLRQAGGEKRII